MRHGRRASRRPGAVGVPPVLRASSPPAPSSPDGRRPSRRAEARAAPPTLLPAHPRPGARPPPPSARPRLSFHPPFPFLPTERSCPHVPSRSTRASTSICTASCTNWVAGPTSLTTPASSTPTSGTRTAGLSGWPRHRVVLVARRVRRRPPRPGTTPRGRPAAPGDPPPRLRRDGRRRLSPCPHRAGRPSTRRGHPARWPAPSPRFGLVTGPLSPSEPDARLPQTARARPRPAHSRPGTASPGARPSPSQTSDRKDSSR